MSATASRILVIIGEPELSQHYQLALTAEAYEVLVCHDGSLALQTALDHNPDLIILDITMPNVSGYDLVDILRHTPETAATKIIILAPLIDVTDRQRARELRIDGLHVAARSVVPDVIGRVRHHLRQTA